MKSFLNLLLFAIVMFTAGCGGKENAAVTDNADAKAIADYEANVKAQEEAENAAQKGN